MPLKAVSVMPFLFSEDEDDPDTHMPELIDALELMDAPKPMVVHRPCVRLSSAEAELDAAICADRAARALVASYTEDVLTGPLRRYGRVRLFMGVSRV